MTKESLETGQKITVKIEELKKQISWLESPDARIFRNIELINGHISIENIDFKTFKHFTLAKMREELKTLEKEFKNL